MIFKKGIRGPRMNYRPLVCVPFTISLLFFDLALLKMLFKLFKAIWINCIIANHLAEEGVKNGWRANAKQISRNTNSFEIQHEDALVTPLS